MSKRGRRRSRGYGRQVGRGIFVLLSITLMIGLIVSQVVNIAKKNSRNTETEQEKLTAVNESVLDTAESIIYEKSEQSTIDEVASMEECINSNTDESVNDMENVLPMIKKWYETGQWDELFEHLNFEEIDKQGLSTSKDRCREQFEKLNADTKHEHVQLQFHNVQRVADKYICPVSVIGIKENTEGNLLYDYENVIETVFTIYQAEDDYKWLPYNVMLGVTIDEYSIFR